MNFAAPQPGLSDLNLRIALQRMAAEAMDRGDGPIAAILEVAVRTIDERIARGEMSGGEAGPGIATGLVSRNVRVAGRRTTVKLESAFWSSLERLAVDNDITVDDVITTAHSHYDGGNLASAIRILALRCAEGWDAFR